MGLECYECLIVGEEVEEWFGQSFGAKESDPLKWGGPGVFIGEVQGLGRLGRPVLSRERARASA